MGGPNPKAKQTDPAVDHRLSTIEAQQQDTATKQKEIETLFLLLSFSCAILSKQ